MPDAIPLVDWPASQEAGAIQGRGGGWTGMTCRPTWSGSPGVIAIQPHRNDEVEVLVVIVAGRGELTLDGQVHQLAPMVVAHLPKGTVRAIAAVDGPLAYLSLHRRRSGGLQVGRHASDAEVPRASLGEVSVCRSTHWSLTVAATKSS
jgi:hypothetical protein